MINTRKGYAINKRDLTKREYNSIKNWLTLEQKSFTGIGELVKAYTEDKKRIYVPKFWGMNRYGPYASVEYKTQKIDINFNGQLRDNQKSVFTSVKNFLEKNKGCVLILPCGFGKTIIAIKLMVYFSLKTIIIVHREVILDQWVNSIKKFTGITPGIVRGDRVETNRPIIIAMLASIGMKKYADSDFNGIQMTIVDEVHHIGSKVLSSALRKVGCEYSLGLTATPNRNDGLFNIVSWYIGESLCPYITDTKISILVTAVKFERRTDEKFIKVKGKGLVPAVSKMVTDLSRLSERNNIIINYINQMSKISRVLVLSDRVDQLIQLSKGLNNLDFVILTSKSTLKERNDIQTATVVLSTYGLSSEGLDVTGLTSLVLATPRKEIQQVVGRVTRDKSKVTRILDIIDTFSLFLGQSYVRTRYYRSVNAKLEIVEELHKETSSYN